MNVPARLGAFGLVLVTALGGGVAAGNAVGPIEGGDGGGGASAEGHGGHAETDPATASAPTTDESPVAGLSATAGGYMLVAGDTVVAEPAAEPFTFRIDGPDGEVVTDFEPRHERDLHLIVVRSDLSVYAHLHPDRADDGTWSIVLGDLPPGVFRLLADFAAAGGPELTLGLDVTVPGASVPAPLPPPAATAVVDGYEVTLTGAPVAEGATTPVTLTVARGGTPVTDLEPYLGSFGHLVAIRSGDLAYLHVHPTGAPPTRPDATGGPEVPFEVTVPGPGDYRLYFDFADEGRARTAAFTLHVPDGADQAAGQPAATLPAAPAAEHDDGHGEHE